MQPNGMVLTTAQPADEVRKLLEAAMAEDQPVSIAITGTDAIESIELKVRLVTRTEAVCTTAEDGSPVIVSLEASSKSATIIGPTLPLG